MNQPVFASQKDIAVKPFEESLEGAGMELKRAWTKAIQVNTGPLCNQRCRHCHLDAGPERVESMDALTMEEVAAAVERCGFDTVDVTGGAPEMVEGIGGFLERLAGIAPKVILRSNLTVLGQPGRRDLINLLARNKIEVIASFPSLSAAQTDRQRGEGVTVSSLRTLKLLNAAGYGREGSGLILDLVSNPAGAFLPTDQESAGKRMKAELERRHGIVFNNFYALANVPLGRFKAWLEENGNYDGYMETLASSFNPCTVEGLMCRTQISVDWKGRLYDCDFNLAAGLPILGEASHVSGLSSVPEPGARIATGIHCYACTAGSGFT